ncbi:hypothetical protein KUTeg_019979 [Tegillarca granosa]|uniref:Dual specificity protein phosphatase 22 n=1 Tax=Tegillarca granosa TaxID=220873 RepID=A0ABQ9EK13_TEGGR|nr:hypothetical protein KUTeg_019979 [Tegillarca granosa]
MLHTHTSFNMGNGMNKIIPGLYVGNFRDAKDEQQLKDNKITHIVAIHDNAKKLRDDMEYLCVIASDTPDQELMQFFPQCIDFIHKARLKGGNVLIHCLAGVSRSVTIACAYIMTVTELGWRDSINAVRGARDQANPNFGFQRQLQKYETELVEKERKRIKENFEKVPCNDEEECRHLMIYYRKKLMGSPDKDDKLYPLPYKAYGERDKSKDLPSSTEKSDKTSSRDTKRDAIHVNSSSKETTVDDLFNSKSQGASNTS